MKKLISIVNNEKGSPLVIVILVLVLLTVIGMEVTSFLPLDSKKYRTVSLMNRVSNRTVRRMYWTRNGNWPDGTYVAGGNDGTFQTGSRGESDGYQTNGEQSVHNDFHLKRSGKCSGER